MDTQQPITIGQPTERKLEEVRNVDYDLPVFHPGKDWEAIRNLIDSNDIEERYAKLMLPLPKGEAVEGEFMRLGGKEDSRYAVLKDSKDAEFRIWASGQLAFKLSNDVEPGDYLRITYLGKTEEPVEIEVDGKKKKVFPHQYRVEADRTKTAH